MTNQTTVALAARAAAPGPTQPDSSDSNFDMDRVYLLDTVRVEQQLFSELVQPLVDRFLAGFNGTVHI